MELIRVVNQRTGERRICRRNKRVKKHLRIVWTCAAVTLAFLLFAVTDLVNPILATVIMMASLMIGCFHLGRCVRFGKWVR